MSNLVIEDPYELLCQLDEKRDVKIADNIRTVFPNVILYDISLSIQGPNEDELYSESEFYRQNIRSGNTFLQILQDQHIKETIVVRRGMKKFFDLQRVLDNGINSKSYEKRFNEITFNDVKQALNNNKKIHVFSTLKANGENAQVTYVRELETWLIASKNVSILASSREHLSHYKQPRYHCTTSVGQQWFNILEELQGKYGRQRIEDLKSDLENRTMLGEYCGNQQYQHLVKYDRVTIYWFGVVAHNSHDTCIDVQTSQDFFRAYQLDAVQVKDLGIYSDFKLLSETLIKQYDEITSGALQQYAEGCVLYLQAVDTKETVLSMCKVRTLEYRVYKKLHEKLLVYFSSKKSANQLYKAYEDELYNLCGNTEKSICTPKTLKYYLAIADYAFEYAEFYTKDGNSIQNEFVTFLQAAQECVYDNKKITPAIIDRVRQEAIKNLVVLQPKQSHYDKQKQLIAIIPVGVPGMGKSTLFTNVQIHVLSTYSDVEVRIVSSDKIRARLMSKERKKTNSSDRLFERTQKDSAASFDIDVRSELEDFVKKSPFRVLLLILDKNYPPQRIEEQVQKLKKFEHEKLTVKVVAVVPECVVPLRSLNIPFSLHFIMSCINRVQSRKQHETLVGNGKESLKVMAMFLRLFRNQKLQFNCVDKTLQYKFVKENDLSDKQYEMVCENDLVEILRMDKDDDDLYENFLESLKYNTPVQKVEEDSQQAKELIGTVFEVLEVFPLLKVKKQRSSQDKIVQFEVVKSPEYLGIFLMGNIWSAIDKWVYECMWRAEKKYKSFTPIYNEFSNFINDGEKAYKRVVKPHVNVLYVGDDIDQNYKTSKEYVDFQTGQKYHLVLDGIVVCRNHIITAVVQTKLLPPIHNKYPHITLYTGSMQAKDSNLVLESLFSQRINTDVLKFPIPYNGMMLDGFYVNADKPLILEGMSRQHYS